MIRYIACGQIIDSEIPLPELSSHPATEGAPSILIRQSSLPFPDFSDWFHRWVMPDGSTWLQIGRQHRDYLLRFPDMADFLVETESATIYVYAGSKSSPETLRHLLLDQVLPLVIASAGKLLLHASAVLVPGGIAVFMGESGKGKSTLAASFCEAGYPLVTDDCLLIEQRDDGFCGLCSYPGLRLWEDSAYTLFPDEIPEFKKVAHYSEKLRVSRTAEYLGTRTDSAPIGKIYLLDPDDTAKDVTLHRISGARTVVSILQYVFHLDVKDPDSLRVQFDWLSRLAKARPVYRLCFPRGYEYLFSIRNVVLEHMGQSETVNSGEECL